MELEGCPHEQDGLIHPHAERTAPSLIALCRFFLATVTCEREFGEISLGTSLRPLASVALPAA
jgi:hypothetical protein